MPVSVPTSDDYDQLETRVAALENDLSVSPPNGGSGPIVHRGSRVEVTEPIGAKQLNDLIQKKHNEGGGLIQLLALDGQVWNEPIFNRPGVILEAGYMPMIYTKQKVRVRTQHTGPVFWGTDDVDPSGDYWQAWGASAIRGFQVETKDGQTALVQQEGGNMSRYYDITSVGGKVANTILVNQGRRYDGQYTIFERVSSTRTGLGLNVQRGVPDNQYQYCLWYGSSTIGADGKPSNQTDISIYLGDDVHNQTITECHGQFCRMYASVGGRENTIRGGSWENKSSDHKKVEAGASPYVILFQLRSSLEDFNVDELSLANTKVIKKLFDVQSDRGITAEFFFTSPNRSHVQSITPDYMTDNVRWIKEIRK